VEWASTGGHVENFWWTWTGRKELQMLLMMQNDADHFRWTLTLLVDMVDTLLVGILRWTLGIEEICLWTGNIHARGHGLWKNGQERNMHMDIDCGRMGREETCTRTRTVDMEIDLLLANRT
jgi:hypothetical protein